MAPRLALFPSAVKVVKRMQVLQTVVNRTVQVSRPNKVLVSHLNKLATKVIIRQGWLSLTLGTEVVMRCMTEEIGASESVKTILNFSIFARLAPDLAQCGLEVAGYKEVGKKVGRWGNIVIGVLAGIVATGSAWPVGATVGALVGFGTWCIGEGVGQAVEEALS